MLLPTTVKGQLLNSPLLRTYLLSGTMVRQDTAARHVRPVFGATEKGRLAMGMFDFAAKAGEKILEKAEIKEAIAKAKAASDPAEAARQQAEALKVAQEANLKKSDALEAHIKRLGLSVEGLDVRYQSGVAVVAGTVKADVRDKVVVAVGNVQGVSRVVDQMTLLEEAPDPVLHTVKKGDTLSKIAKNYYGDGSKYPVIFEANKPMLKHPDKIYIGQVLTIPPEK